MRGVGEPHSWTSTVIADITQAYKDAIGVFTPAQIAAENVVLARGSFDPLILTQGTIAYLFTFDTGYKLLWLDSAGPITNQLRTAMETIKNTNLTIIAYVGQFVARAQIAVTCHSSSYSIRSW